MKAVLIARSPFADSSIGKICWLFPHSNLLHESQQSALIFSGPHGRPLGSATSGAMTRQWGDRQLRCKLPPVQPLHKHYVDAAGNQISESRVEHALCLAK
jgi:hypothetical protein